jgi:hypothetical protein
MRRLILAAAVNGFLTSCGGIGYPDPQSNCTVFDRGKWLSSSLSQSNVQQPFCPHVIGTNSQATGYSINVIASDLSKLRPAPYAIVSFFNNSGLPIPPDISHKDRAFGFNGNTAQVWGIYLAASVVGPVIGSDYARVRVTLVAINDSARSEAALLYKFHSSPAVTAPSTGSTFQPVVVAVDASAEIRPITYEWWIDGAHQGPPSSTSSLNHLFSQAGGHSVRTVIRANDGHVYDVTKYIEIYPCPNGEIIC